MDWIQGIIHSRLIWVLAAGFIVPAMIFSLYSKKLKGFLLPWGILGILLFLSFTVSGLNVVLELCGPFFPNRSCPKGPAHILVVSLCICFGICGGHAHCGYLHLHPAKTGTFLARMDHQQFHRQLSEKQSLLQPDNG